MSFTSPLRLIATLAEDLPGAVPDGGRSLTFVGAPPALHDRHRQPAQAAMSAPQRQPVHGQHDDLVAA